MEEKKIEKKEERPLAKGIANRAYECFKKRGFTEFIKRFKTPKELAEHIKKEENILAYLRLLTAFPPASEPVESVDEKLIRDIRVLLLGKKPRAKIEQQVGNI